MASGVVPRPASRVGENGIGKCDFLELGVGCGLGLRGSFVWIMVNTPSMLKLRIGRGLNEVSSTWVMFQRLLSVR